MKGSYQYQFDWFSMQPKKTVTQSFRLDEEVLKKLSEEALKQRISLNNLVDHVLEDHVGLGY